MLFRRSIVIVSLAAALLAACGAGSDSQEPAVSAGEAPDVSTAAAGSFNEADVTFAQGMIPHHEQAIEIADIALDPAIGASAAIKDLAATIKAAQDPEIEQMKALLVSWGQSIEMDMSDGHSMSDMDGMMSADEMAGLEALTGAEFDTMWAAMMIEHHRGAISMAKTVKNTGSNVASLALADAIIAGQSAEIEILTPIAS